ncbi:HepT-like ribonuclease domain-containing protein [Leptospira noguchii]|nr:HepT-like ribonuclease domain-containing protein [Leptospira noguchii]
MRDIISHHYEGLDHEIIFSICKDKLKGSQVFYY